jgi:hypothetical protein
VIFDTVGSTSARNLAAVIFGLLAIALKSALPSRGVITGGRPLRGRELQEAWFGAFLKIERQVE